MATLYMYICSYHLNYLFESTVVFLVCMSHCGCSYDDASFCLLTSALSYLILATVRNFKPLNVNDFCVSNRSCGHNICLLHTFMLGTNAVGF